MKTEIHFRSPCHPQANGRTPQPGDVSYTFRFPTEDERELVVEVGEKGFDAVSQMVLDMLAGTPSYDDGSTNAGG
jgi:hypothetical protein